MNIEEKERNSAIILIASAKKEASTHSANPEDIEAATYGVLLRALDIFSTNIGMPNWRYANIGN